MVERGITHVVAGKEHTGSQKALDGKKTPGCVVVRDGWLIESYWRISQGKIESFLVGKGPAQSMPLSAHTASGNALKTSYPLKSATEIEPSPINNDLGSNDNYIDDSFDNDDMDDDDDDDDDFAAAFEEEFMNG